ncbi:MAG: hypothetical protein P1P87_14190, partial [Trueperaceae bacterium]|nr:hypothetical protein [Trueperaceae bacterium]
MRPLAVLFSVLVAVVGGAAHAQGVSIVVPPDRFVAPDAFATLVFRVEATAAVEADIAADVDAGWTVLRPPGRQRLEAGLSTPVAVTIQVPSAAAAGSRGEVRFTVDAPSGVVERVVVLTVTERVDVGLQAPAEYTIGTDGFEVVVSNGGNVEERATLEVRRDGAVLDRRSLELAPAASARARFDPTEEGLLEVVLTTERGAELRRSVRVLRFGTGLDAPFALSGEVGATFGTSGRRALVVGLQGALSDFVTVDARVDVAAWTRSYAAAEATSWTVRLGAGWRDPFGLALPSDPGVAAWWQGDAWGVAAHAGWLGEDRFGGTVSVGWTAGSTLVAGGLGVRHGATIVGFRATATPRAGLDLVGTAGLRGGAVDVSLQVDVREDRADSRVAVAGLGLTGAASRLDLGVRHRVGPAEVYVDGTVPIGPSTAWAGRVGFREAPVTPMAGTVEIAAQAGTATSFARVGYRTEVGAGWRAGSTGGIRYDTDGFGVTFDASVARAGTDPIDLDARLDYRPATGRVGGRVGAQARFATDPLDVSLAVGWDLTERDVAAGAVVAWSEGPWSWEL